MKFLFDYFPIILFFAAYKLSANNIMVATSSAIVASSIQVVYFKLTHGKVQKMHLISFFSILILGGATLLLKDELYVKWKPTVVYWALSLVIILSNFIGKKPILQRLGEATIDAPDKIWRQVNISWGVFFFALGSLNLYVLYTFDTNFWVNFKLFGTIGLTLIFIIIQAFYMAKYIKTPNGNH